MQEQSGYAYDKAWNLNYRTNNSLLETFAVNSLNELSSVSRSGTLTVAGTSTSPASSVNVSGTGISGSQAAAFYADSTWALAGVTPANGQNTFTATATDNYNRTSQASATVNLPASSTLTYDANGNLLGDGTRSFAYDDENQLTSVWVTNAWRSDFVYDGLMRRRIRKEFTWAGGAWVQTNEVHYVYDGSLVIQERYFDPQISMEIPNDTVTYTRGNDLSSSLQGAGGIGGLLARTDSSLLNANSPSANAYYACDASGNVTCLINQSNMVVARYEYDPFGNVLSKSGLLADANLYRFSSKEWHGNSGLSYSLYRFYDAGLQRWVNRDPIGEVGSINLYSFVNSDPLGLLDPFGLVQLGCAFQALAGAIGNGFGVAGGILLGAGTSWSGIGAVAGAVLAGKSAYGLGANLLNLYDALADKKAQSTGALITDVLPKTPNWQRFGTALDLATDLAGMRIPRAAVTVPKAGKFGETLLEGGAKLGPNFTDRADSAIATLAGIQAAQSAVQQVSGGGGGGCN